MPVFGWEDSRNPRPQSTVSGQHARRQPVSSIEVQPLDLKAAEASGFYERRFKSFTRWKLLGGETAP
jgi:hypothetical protein